VPFEEFGPLAQDVVVHLAGRAGGEPQRTRVVVGRLPVRPGRRRALRRDPGVGEYGRAVSGLFRVVGEPRRIGLGTGREAEEDPRVQRGSSRGRYGLLDGQPGQLVPEADAGPLADEHAGAHARVDGRPRVPATGGVEPVEQEQLRPVGHDRDGVEDGARVRVEAGDPGKHRVTHGRGYRRSRLGEHLADEERVAAGPQVDLAGVHAVWPGEPGDRLGRQRAQPDPVRGAFGGE
jgi:hypothetical protein